MLKQISSYLQAPPLSSSHVVKTPEEEVFTLEDECDLTRLNAIELSLKKIARIAASLDHTKLVHEQNRLLKFVRHSRLSDKHKIAAANAIMILKETGFSFEGISLRGIRIPHANLSKTILNRVDFTGADLNGVNFSDSSLLGTIFNDANFDQVNLGYAPTLHHNMEFVDDSPFKNNVVQMTLFHNQKYLLTLARRGFYVWNLENMKCVDIEKEEFSLFGSSEIDASHGLLLVSRDEKYFFRTYRRPWAVEYTIDIVDAASLERVGSKFILDKSDIDTFIAAADEYYIITYGNKIEILKLEIEDQGVPKFIRKQSKVIESLSGSFNASYNFDINCLAICKDNRIELYSIPDLTLIKSWSNPVGLPSGNFSGIEFSYSRSILLITYENQVYQWNIELEQGELFFSEEKYDPNDRISPPIKIMGIKIDQHSPYIVVMSAWGNQMKITIRLIENPKMIFSKFDGRQEWTLKFPIQSNTILRGNQLIKYFKDSVIISELKPILDEEKEPEVSDHADVRFTKDSNQIMVVTPQGTLHYFRCMTGKPSASVHALNEHSLEISPTHLGTISEEIRNKLINFQISEDGTYIISQHYNNYSHRDGIDSYNHLRMSRIEDGHVCHQIDKPFLSCALSKDNRHIVYLLENGILEIWNTQENKVVNQVFWKEGVQNNMKILAISPTIFPAGYVVIKYNKNYISSRAYLCFIDWNEGVGKMVSKSILRHRRIRLDETKHFRSERIAKFVGNTLFYKNAYKTIQQCDLPMRLQALRLETIPPWVVLNERAQRDAAITGMDVSEDQKYLICTDNYYHVGLWDLQQRQWTCLQTSYIASCAIVSQWALFSAVGRGASIWH